MNTKPFVISVSGHQNLGDEQTQHFVAQQFRDLLCQYQQREMAIVLYSALAAGADQLFVKIALECKIPVEIALPCNESAYKASLPTEEARQEYSRLLSLCQQQHYLSPQECSDDAYLALGEWLVDHSDLIVLAWNGQPSKGRGGTADVASYAHFRGHPFVHIHTLHHTVTTYGKPFTRSRTISPKHTFVTAKYPVYQSSVLTVQQYHLQMPNEGEVIRDVVEMPQNVLVLPLAQHDIVLLVEEYNFGIGEWQLKLPGGKVEKQSSNGLHEQVQRELQQETGYRAKNIEKFYSLSSHPGYVSHQIEVFVAKDLEWNPLPQDTHEEIRVQTYSLKEALAATYIDNRYEPESALVLWLYAYRNIAIERL